MSLEILIDVKAFVEELDRFSRDGEQLCKRFRDTCGEPVTTYRRDVYIEEYVSWIIKVGKFLQRNTKDRSLTATFPIKANKVTVNREEDEYDDFILDFCDEFHKKIEAVKGIIDSMVATTDGNTQPEENSVIKSIQDQVRPDYGPDEINHVLQMLAKFKDAYKLLIDALEEKAIEIPLEFANSGEETVRRLRETAICEAHELTKDGLNPFNLDHSLHKKWIFDYSFLLGFYSALESRKFKDEKQLQEAIQLFLLHELIHPDQAITSRNAVNLGRSGIVLELADYDADVFAVEIMYRLRLATEGGFARKPAKEHYAELIQTALIGLSLFDESEQGGLPLRVLPIRRLRRYLIWHFQWTRVKMTNTDPIPELWLRSKPSLEITFLDEKWDSGRFQNYIEVESPGNNSESQIVAYCNHRILRGQHASAQNSPQAIIKGISKGIGGIVEVSNALAFYLEGAWKSALRL